jgi:hypothetical protein
LQTGETESNGSKALASQDNTKIGARILRQN